MELLSAYVKNLRLEAGLDQKEFAKILGTTQATISNIENGKSDFKVPTSKIIDLLEQYKGDSAIKIMEKFIDIKPDPSREKLFTRSPFSTFENYQHLFTSFTARLEYLRLGTQTLPTELFGQANYLSYELIAKYKSRTIDSTIVSFFTVGMSIVSQKYSHYQDILNITNSSEDIDMSKLNKDFENWFLSWDQRFDFYKIVIDEMFKDTIFYGNKKSKIIIFVFNESNRIEKEAFEYLCDTLDISNLPPYYYSLFLYRDGSVKSAAIKEYNQLKNIFYNR